MDENMDHQNRSLWINYLYYGSLFAIVLILSVSSIYCHEDMAGSRFFFLFYSIGEALLEVFLFIAAGWLIRRYLPPLLFTLFIVITFAFALIHLIDFLLNRIVNVSVWEMIDYVFDETFDNFLNMLDAAGLPFWMWGVIFLSLILIPLLGVLVFRFTEWIAGWRPFGCCFEKILQALFCLPIALFLWDYSASHFIPQEAHRVFSSSLPWRITFLRPNVPTLSLKQTLPPPLSEEETLASLETFSAKPKKKPNIYLFVVESLRENILDQETAPWISQFREQSLHAKKSLSNANGTPLSWYSIFHSNFAFYWSNVKQQNRELPASGLALLQKMGYKIRVYSSANLSYYSMDKLLFGKSLAGADELQMFLHPAPKEAWESDAEALQAFERDFSENPDLKEGQCFVFFWDATHFPYSWPKEEASRFHPVAKDWEYFNAYPTKKNIAAIKNSYRNAVHYIDSLFGRFLSNTEGIENAIVVFTGDHGQEFFEYGHLFHLSELNKMQTEVPIYFQLPQKPAIQPELASHIDIFPTILDAIAPGAALPSALKGESLLQPRQWPFVAIARYNASRPPCEIALHDGKHKMIARFTNKRDIYKSTAISILSLRTAEEKLVKVESEDLEDWIELEFRDGLNRLFTK